VIWSASTFIAACIVLAVYNFYSIRGRTNSIAWHICQYKLIALFVLSGFLLGRIEGLNWHTWHLFGEIVGVCGLGVSVYVFVLHWLLKRF
jgi:hypothetical protein